MDACTLISWGHTLTGLGLLLLGLVAGVAANLERIGRIARWRSAMEGRRPAGMSDEQAARLHRAMQERYWS